MLSAFLAPDSLVSLSLGMLWINWLGYAELQRTNKVAVSIDKHLVLTWLFCFARYNAIIERFEMAIHWVQDEGINFDVQDVRTRITGNMAWVTMKAYVEIAGGPFHVTNIFEFHNGQWLMVHHHSSGMLVVGGITQHQLLGLFEV